MIKRCSFTMQNGAISNLILKGSTPQHTNDTYTKMTGKLSIFMTTRSHITKIGDLEATEDFVKLTSGLCFTFLGAGSNPGWRTYFLL